MDDRKHSISPDDLYARLGSEAAPIIVDVRRDADFAGADTLVADAFHCSPDDVEQWRTELQGGIARWTEKGMPTRRNTGRLRASG